MLQNLRPLSAEEARAELALAADIHLSEEDAVPTPVNTDAWKAMNWTLAVCVTTTAFLELLQFRTGRQRPFRVR
ncbi:hypothetical protein WDV93_16810 [Pantoea ananatis]